MKRFLTFMLVVLFATSVQAAPWYGDLNITGDVSVGGNLSSTLGMKGQAWVAEETYALGDVATSGGSIYVSLQNANIGNLVTDVAWWKEQTGGGGGAVEVQDEGITVEADTGLFNFVGSGVTVTPGVAGAVDVTVAGGAAPVDSVFGRTGTVLPVSGDYDATEIANFDVEVANNIDVAANTTHRGTVIGNPHAVTKSEVALGNVQNVDQTNADNITGGTVADARIAATIARDSELPTLVSQLTNDSAFISNLGETDQVFTASDAFAITALQIGNWDTSYTRTGNLITLSGRPEGSTDQGTFTGTTFLDAQTNHALFQAVETWIEGLTAAAVTDFDVEVANNADVAANTTHRASTGADHSYIDQPVTSGATPTFTGTNFSGIPDGALTSGATVISAGAGDSGKLVKLDAEGNVDATTINAADISHLNISDIGTNTHAQIDTHIATVSGNPHAVIAVEVPIADAGTIITATDVEGALQENRTAIDLNTAKPAVPSGSIINDILQWDGLDWIAQGQINGLFDDTSSSPTKALSSLEIDSRIAESVDTFQYTEQAADPAPGDNPDKTWVFATTSGDAFFQTATGLFNVSAGTYTAGVAEYTLYLSVTGDASSSVTINATPYTPAGSPYTIPGFILDEAVPMTTSYGGTDDGIDWAGADGIDVTGTHPNFSITMSSNKTIEANFTDSTAYYDSTKPTDTTLTLLAGPYGLGTNLTAAYIFNANTGTAVQDYAGTNDGTLTGTSSWHGTNEGVAFAIEDDSVDLTSPLTLANGTSLSVRVWRSGGQFEGAFWGPETTHNYISIFQNTLLIEGCTSYPITPAQWNTVTIVKGYDGDFTFYINGVLQGSQDCGITSILTYALGVGYTTPETAFGLVGYLDYVYFHNRPLVEQEVIDLYNHPYSMFHL